MQNKIDYLIAVDWLAYSAYGIIDETPKLEVSRYKIVKRDYGTQVFKNCGAIVDCQTLEEVANIQYSPRSSALKQNLIIIKLTNRILYEQNYIHVINNINNEFNFVFNAISRIDICADFYTFKCFGCQQLIRGFLTRKYRRYGKTNYVLHGNQAKEQEFEYLKFGSGTSDVQVYLYNKSEELRAVKSKPYISERWQALSYNFDDVTPPPDVWRLEFRVVNKNICAINKEGEFFDITLQNIYGDKLTSIYAGLVSRYWKWAINDKKESKFVNLKELQMFDFGNTECILQTQTQARQEKANTVQNFLDDIITYGRNAGVHSEIIGNIYASCAMQLPMSNEKQKRDNKRSIAIFLRHFIQAKDVLNLPDKEYKEMWVRLKYSYPIEFEKAEYWSVVQNFRNAGDIF